MDRDTDRAIMSLCMETSTQEHGSRAEGLVREPRPSSTKTLMLEAGKRTSSMGQVRISMLMTVSILEASQTITSKE